MRVDLSRRAVRLRRPRSRRLDCVSALGGGSALLRRHCHGTRRRMLAGDRCNRAYTEPFPGIHRGDAVARGRARICREGLYGFIDAGGRESVAPVYPFAGAFREGRAKVRLQEDYFYIDRDGCKIGE
ncbi:MAG: WG repeat-containing protein [Alistipes indistinctus]